MTIVEIKQAVQNLDINKVTVHSDDMRRIVDHINNLEYLLRKEKDKSRELERNNMQLERDNGMLLEMVNVKSLDEYV